MKVFTTFVAFSCALTIDNIKRADNPLHGDFMRSYLTEPTNGKPFEFATYEKRSESDKQSDMWYALGLYLQSLVGFY